MVGKVVLLILFLFFTSSRTQEIIKDQHYPSDPKLSEKMRKQEKRLPTSYICGAGVWKNKRLASLNTHYHYSYFRFYQWQTINYAMATNGIKFQYCHFEQWNRQISMEEKGVDEWSGIKMCPEGQYVHGFRTKIDIKNGLQGLVLFCRSMKNSKLASEVLVIDGGGAWRNPIVSANFAVGFKTQFLSTSIYGLAFEMAPAPYIFAYNFNYQFPKDFTPSPLLIERFVVQNYGAREMRKEIQFTKTKTFKRVWRNEKGLYHQVSQKHQHRQQRASYSFMVPTLSKTGESYTMTKSSFQAQGQKAGFGFSHSYEVGNRHKDIVPIPACTKTVIQQIVFIYQLDIPYNLEVGFTNGVTNDFEIINGVYRGVTASEAVVRITSEKIC